MTKVRFTLTQGDRKEEALFEGATPYGGKVSFSGDRVLPASDRELILAGCINDPSTLALQFDSLKRQDIATETTILDADGPVFVLAEEDPGH